MFNGVVVRRDRVYGAANGHRSHHINEKGDKK